MPNLSSDQFAVGFTEDLGTAWWATEADRGINQFNQSVPLTVAYDMLDWMPIREPLPYRYADQPEPMVMLINPTNNMLVGVHTSEYPDTGYGQRLLDNTSRLIDADLGTVIGAVGLLAGGRQAFVQITLNDLMVHSSTGERFQTWLCAYSSLDGKYATTYQTGLTRVVCRNTFQAFRGESTKQNTYRYRNTKNNVLHIQTAREVLQLFDGMQTDIWTELDRMVDTKVSEGQWEQILDRLLPTQGMSGRGLTLRQNKRDVIDQMYRSDDRVGYVGTEWGALQALTTWHQHETTVRENETKGSRNVSWLLSGAMENTETQFRSIIDSVLRPKERSLATV